MSSFHCITDHSATRSDNNSNELGIPTPEYSGPVRASHVPLRSRISGVGLLRKTSLARSRRITRLRGGASSRLSEEQRNNLDLFSKTLLETNEDWTDWTGEKIIDVSPWFTKSQEENKIRLSNVTLLHDAILDSKFQDVCLIIEAAIQRGFLEKLLQVKIQAEVPDNLEMFKWLMGANVIHLSTMFDDKSLDHLLDVIEALPETANAQEMKKLKNDFHNEVGFTPLHIASKVGKTIATRLLIRANVDINATDYLNQTPLHLASKSNRTTLLW